jgi:hypothetical protein
MLAVPIFGRQMIGNTLATFQARFWSYNHVLQVYEERPTGAEPVRLEAVTDSLFATGTDYAALDERIARTADPGMTSAPSRESPSVRVVEG